jgi:hypothetical protein
MLNASIAHKKVGVAGAIESFLSSGRAFAAIKQ